MKKHILLILFIATTYSVSAQSEIYSLHSIIGDTISKSEAELYLLFETHKDINFEYMLIEKTDTSFNLVAFNESKITINRRIDLTEINTQKEHINKLNAYYEYKKNDTCLVLSDTLIKTTNIETDYLSTPEFKKGIKKEIKRAYSAKKGQEFKEDMGKIYR